MSFTPIDLSLLPAPTVVETLDFDTIRDAMIDDLQTRDTTFTALVESDPAYKIIEVAAYRELLIRQRVNDAARAVMLAYAAGTDLEQLGGLFGVTRNVITPADSTAVPPTDAVMESDTDLRKRIQLSLEGLATAGPVGAYRFHALSISDVLDVSITSPNPGDVLVSVLSRTGDGTPSAETLDEVRSALNAEDVRPLTDNVIVQGAELVKYSIQATIYTYTGPDPDTVISASQAAADTYVASQHKLGLDVTLSGIYAALHQSGVQRVALASPTADIVISPIQASYCTGITLTNGGTAA
ncbi:MAG: baseplate J/gp47 family protein [Chthoniobacteraceae bacterium]